MHIKQVADQTGASRKAIYLYESMRLLNDVARDENGYRRYTDHHLKIVGLIRRAQKLGFKLAEISPLVEEKMATNRFPTELVVEKIEAKRASIRSEIDSLNSQSAALAELKKEVSAGGF